MVGAVDEGGLDVHHRVAGQDTGEHGVLDPGVHAGDVLAGHAATGDGVGELVVRLLAVGGLGGLVGHEGLEAHLHLGELAGTTRLLLVGVLDLVHLLADGLAVGDLRGAHVGLDLELAAHAVHEHVQVELAHTADDGLAGLLVEGDGEGGVLLGELLDGHAQLLLVALGLGLDGHVDDRGREGHGLQDDRGALGAQGVTGGDVLEADEGVDVAGVGLLHRVLLVGVHLEELADALLLALGGVEDHLALGDLAGVDAHVDELAVEGVGGHLEGQGGEGSLLVGRTGEHLLLVTDGVALDVGDVERGGQVVQDGVEHGLDALVLEGGPGQDREGLTGHGELADTGLELGDAELLALEVLLHEGVVGLGDRLDQLAAQLLGLGDQLGGDLLVLDDGAAGVLAVGVLLGEADGPHLQDVDEAGELVLGADREVEDDRGGVEAVADGLDGEVEVRAQLVHLVDVADARDVVLVRLAPHRLGLRLHALLAVEDRDGAVEHAQGALDLDREVHVAGGVDDVDLVVLPEAGGGRGGDGDTALLLLLHPVHGRGAVVRLADLVVDARVEQDALCHGGLTGIDVGHDADVADLGEVCQHVKCHWWCPSFVWGTELIPALPAVVGEGLVGLGHAVHVLAALDRGAQAVGGVENLVHETLGHGVLAALAGEVHEPAQRQGGGAAGADLDGHLVGGTTDATGADLQGGADVVQSALEDRDRVLVRLGAHALQGAVDDPLGSGLLAVQQNAVDELGDDRRAVDGVDDERTLGCGTLTRHYFFSFLAPYLERACWRPLTPWVSRAPRTMW